MFPGKCAKIPTFFSLNRLKIMTKIIHINKVQTMTSLEIAELTGKQHNDLMKAIRKMEPAWEKVNGGNFSLVEYRDKKGELRPCYQLTKTECLYIATKFNDEARAKLVLRWEELEMADGRRKMEEGRGQMSEVRCLPEPKEILQLADHIMGEALSELNADTEDTLTATQVAKTFNMDVRDFNAVLKDMGIQYRRGGHWNIADELEGRGYTALRTHVGYSLKGVKKIDTYMTWTMAGLHYLNAKLGYPNF
jgi:phage regulator Rha-like protein